MSLYTHTHTHSLIFATFYRPRWIRIHGYEYHHSDFVTLGFELNDLPSFGQVADILVVVGTPLLHVKRYTTVGINNHLLAYAVVRTYEYTLISLSSLVFAEPLSAHTSIGDSNVYIVMKSHVENTAKQ